MEDKKPDEGKTGVEPQQVEDRDTLDEVLSFSELVVLEHGSIAARDVVKTVLGIYAALQTSPQTRIFARFQSNTTRSDVGERTIQPDTAVWLYPPLSTDVGKQLASQAEQALKSTRCDAIVTFANDSYKMTQATIKRSTSIIHKEPLKMQTSKRVDN